MVVEGGNGERLAGRWGGKNTEIKVRRLPSWPPGPETGLSLGRKGAYCPNVWAEIAEKVRK